MFLVQTAESENHHYSIAKAGHSSLDGGPSQRTICCILDLLVDTVTSIIGCESDPPPKSKPKCKPKCRPKCKPKCVAEESDEDWWATFIWYICDTE